MTADPKTIEGLVPAIRAVANWLSAFDAPSAIVGGIAVSVLGRARATVDIDAVALVEPTNVKEFVTAASQFEIYPRIAGVLEFSVESKMLLLRHRKSGVEVDVVLAGLLFEEEMLERAVETKIADFRVRLPTVEDLIVMKGVANRSHDWVDIEGLIATNPDFDANHILRWLREFADLTETPEVVEKLEDLIHAARNSLKSKRQAKHISKRKVSKSEPTVEDEKKKIAKKTSKKSAPRKKPL